MMYNTEQILPVILYKVIPLHPETLVKFPRPGVIHCPVSNYGFDSFWFRMVLVGHGFISYLASESFLVSFYKKLKI